MSVRPHEALIAALKQALAEPGEQRLFRSGKLTGLFLGKTGMGGEAALQALRDGLFEISRTEIKGKTAIEWVKITPKGVEFLHAHESPLAVLRELQNTLQTTRAGVPVWLAVLEKQFQKFTEGMQDDLKRTVQRLDSLAERVEEALRRADAIGPVVPPGVAASVPWAVEALQYLDHRRFGGAPGDCPMPELFAAIRRARPDLSVIEFQDGLRRMNENKAVRLLPFGEGNGVMPEPEYIMCEGPDLLYYVGR
jgi:hypothetical protein